MILPAIAFIAATYVANVQVPVDRMFTGPLPLVKSQRNAPKQTVAIKPPRSKSPYYKKGHHRTKKIYHAFATKSRQIDRFAMPAMRSAGKIAIRNLAVQAELRANAVVPIRSPFHDQQ